MSGVNKTIKMRNGKKYRIRTRLGGHLCVEKMGFFLTTVGRAKAMKDAILLAEIHAGSTVWSIS